MTIDDLLTAANECLAFDTKAKLTIRETSKIDYLAQRNLIKSRMIWQYGLVTTRQAFEAIGAARLIDKAPKSDLKASATCCMDYEETAIAAAEIGDEDAVKENINARDFLISKIVWQYGVFRVCDAFQEIGFDPIERKELIQILYTAQKSSQPFSPRAEKLNRSIKDDPWTDSQPSATTEQDKFQELIDRINKL